MGTAAELPRLAREIPDILERAKLDDSEIVFAAAFELDPQQILARTERLAKSQARRAERRAKSQARRAERRE